MSCAIPAAADIHMHGCDCAACEPYAAAQADRFSALDRISMLTVAGFGLGMVLVWVVDRVIGGPGVGVMFGA